MKDKYFDFEYWQRWCAELLANVPGYAARYGAASDHPSDVDQGESPAIEVLKYNDPKGYFGGI